MWRYRCAMEAGGWRLRLAVVVGAMWLLFVCGSIAASDARAASSLPAASAEITATPIVQSSDKLTDTLTWFKASTDVSTQSFVVTSNQPSWGGFVKPASGAAMSVSWPVSKRYCQRNYVYTITSYTGNSGTGNANGVLQIQWKDDCPDTYTNPDPVVIVSAAPGAVVPVQPTGPAAPVTVQNTPHVQVDTLPPVVVANTPLPVTAPSSSPIPVTGSTSTTSGDVTLTGVRGPALSLLTVVAGLAAATQAGLLIAQVRAR